MSEEKIVTPAYVRVGICEECGAAVYAVKGGGGLPLMSACACADGQKFVGAAEAAKLARARREDAAKEQANAA